MEKVSLALVSLKPLDNYQANMEKIRSFILRAAKEGASFIVFPEASIQD